MRVEGNQKAALVCIGSRGNSEAMWLAQSVTCIVENVFRKRNLCMREKRPLGYGATLGKPTWCLSTSIPSSTYSNKHPSHTAKKETENRVKSVRFFRNPLICGQHMIIYEPQQSTSHYVPQPFYGQTLTGYESDRSRHRVKPTDGPPDRRRIPLRNLMMVLRSLKQKAN